MEVSEEEIRETYDHFDTDGDGKIDRSEFGRLLDALDAEMSEEEKDAGFDWIDTNNNQAIEFNEFANWWGDR